MFQIFGKSRRNWRMASIDKRSGEGHDAKNETQEFVLGCFNRL